MLFPTLTFVLFAHPIYLFCTRSLAHSLHSLATQLLMRAWTVVGRADRAVAQLDAMQRAGLAVDADVYRALVQPHLMLLLDSADGLSPGSAASSDSASTSGVVASAGSGSLVASVGSSAESKSSTATPVVASTSAIPAHDRSSELASTKATHTVADQKPSNAYLLDLQRLLVRTRPIVGVLEQLAHELGLFVSADDTYRALVRAWCTLPRPTRIQSVNQNLLIRMAIRDLLLFRLRALRVRPTPAIVIFALQCVAAAKSTAHASVVLQFAFFVQQRCRMSDPSAPVARLLPSNSAADASPLASTLANALDMPNMAPKSAVPSEAAVDAEVAAALLHADVWVYLLSTARSAKDWNLLRNCIKQCASQFGAAVQDSSDAATQDSSSSLSMTAAAAETATVAPVATTTTETAPAANVTPAMAALREELKRARAFIYQNRPVPKHQNQARPQPRQQSMQPSHQQKQHRASSNQRSRQFSKQPRQPQQPTPTQAEPLRVTAHTAQLPTAVSSRVL